MPLALRAAAGDGGLWNEHLGKLDVVGARAAHAKHAPGVQDPHAGRLQRDGEMQDRGTSLRIFVDRAGDQEVSGRTAAGERLARGDLEAALSLHSDTAARQPVRAATGDEDQVFGGHALQEPLRRRALMTPAPCGDRNQMGMHGEGQGGGAARRAEAADDVADFRDLRSSAAELDGDQRLEQAFRLQPRIAL
jgi:hypothetical protein